jgi:hypothetical protein
MDTDLIIGIAHALTIAGAIVLLIGLLAIVRPVAAIGLRNRTRASVAALAGLCMAYSGIALLNSVCDPTIPCNRCAANRLPLVTAAHACLRPVTARDGAHGKAH